MLVLSTREEALFKPPAPRHGGAHVPQLPTRMAYTTDMRAAAQRHYADGCKLLTDKRFDNAGYHFGLSAECAIKQKLTEFGLLQDEEAMWKHWPSLRGLARIAIKGRQASAARSLLARESFMQYWEIVMRYAQTGSISEAQAERWRSDANDALGLLI